MRIILLFIAIFFVGCISTGNRDVIEFLPASSLYAESSWGSSKGEYHKVESGETLYGICSLYGAETKDVVKANNLKDPSKIKEGQLLYIPAAKVFKSALSGSNFIWPVKGNIISHFKDSTSKGANKGIDIRLTSAQIVVAAASGEICYSGEDIKGYDKVIMIDHGEGLYSLYAYNDALLVEKGDKVKTGEDISRIDDENGVLHFEIRRDNKPLNPLNFFK